MSTRNGNRRRQPRLYAGEELQQLILSWLDWRAARGEITPRTRYLLSFRLIALERLDPDGVDTWLAHIGSYAPATRRSYRSTFRSFCAWAAARGHIARDLSAEIGHVREPRRAPRALTRDQVHRVLSAASDRQRIMVLLMVQLGLRCCEVAELEVADWDPERGTLLVRGKGANERVLPVAPAVAEALTVHLRGVRTTGPLVPNRFGRRFPNHGVSQLVTDLLYRSGVKTSAHDGISPHALRHTAASDVLDQCHDVRTVQEMLGHQSLSTTQIYLRRANLGQLREAMDGRDYQPAPVVADQPAPVLEERARAAFVSEPGDDEPCFPFDLSDGPYKCSNCGTVRVGRHARILDRAELLPGEVNDDDFRYCLPCLMRIAEGLDELRTARPSPQDPPGCARPPPTAQQVS